MSARRYTKKKVSGKVQKSAYTSFGASSKRWVQQKFAEVLSTSTWTY